MELYEGAPAVGGDDFILEVVELDVVELELLPDS